jgi:hypothetical protein
MSLHSAAPSATPPAAGLASRIFKETNIPLQNFPELYLMEAMTGGFGALFTVGWLLAVRTINSAVADQVLVYPILIVLAFLLLLMASIAVIYDGGLTGFANMRNPASLTAEAKQRLEILARIGIMLLSVGFALTTAVLIWLSGGARSPFVPFFVMTFTLTVSYTRALPWFWILFGFYFFIISVACYMASYHAPHTAVPGDWDKLLAAELQTVLHWFFLGASLFVPALSSWVVERQSRRHLTPTLDKTTTDTAQ